MDLSHSEPAVSTYRRTAASLKFPSPGKLQVPANLLLTTYWPQRWKRLTAARNTGRSYDAQLHQLALNLLDGLGSAAAMALTGRLRRAICGRSSRNCFTETSQHWITTTLNGQLSPTPHVEPHAADYPAPIALLHHHLDLPEHSVTSCRTCQP